MQSCTAIVRIQPSYIFFMPCREVSSRSEVIVIPTSVYLPSSDMPGIVHSVVLMGKLRLAQHGKDEAEI